MVRPSTLSWLIQVVVEQYKRMQKPGTRAKRSDEQRKMKEQQAAEELVWRNKLNRNA